MAFQTPITIKEAVEHIARQDYLLPAIQREFVWKPDQIIRLFDSVLKDYPIGSFLFWEVQGEKKRDFQFYAFLRRYHERDSRHNEKVSLYGDGDITAVLDGQQRLTSLYIGLLGSYSGKLPYYRWESDYAFPETRLYLNLARPSSEFELRYDFQFRSDDRELTRTDDDAWFLVQKVLDFKSLRDVYHFLRTNELIDNEFADESLTRLFEAITQRPTISFYRERDQELDKVLNIFIRVNSGGTPLSYSDLLLSIATAEWQERDAREAIHRLVDEINTEYGEFKFSKDFVLKSCLTLADLDIRWKVDNFNRANMQRIEALWPSIASAIRMGVRLISSFGFSGATLASANAVIPIVYYLHKRQPPVNYVEASAFRTDRELIGRWLKIALLKRTFGGVPDNVLRPLRDTIRTHNETFPFDLLMEALRPTAKSMRFEPEELESLLELKYGGSYTFAILSLLYPGLDFRNRFHQDHIHPRSTFSRAKLARRGIPVEERSYFTDRVDTLPNLQLLEGMPNVEKSNADFQEWLTQQYPSEHERQIYRERHYIPDVDLSFVNFREFYEARRKLMLAELRRIVGLDTTESAVSEPVMT